MNRNENLIKISRVGTCVILILLLYAGCTSEKRVEKDPFFEKWRTLAEKSRGHSPTARKRTLKTPQTQEARGMNKGTLEQNQVARKRSLPTIKTTMRMINTELRVILNTLAKASNLNIMINDSVQGKMSVNVKNTPWNEVFTSVLRSQGYAYSWEGAIIRIITQADADRDLKKLEAEQQIKRKKREMEAAEPLVTEVIRIDFSDAGELKKSLDTFLTVGDGEKPLGSVMVDKYSNSLVIQAIRSDVARMLPIIEQLDQATPQILIESHIVETTKETARELGVQWAGLSRHGDLFVAQTINNEGFFRDQEPEPNFPMLPDLGLEFPAALATGGGLNLGLALARMGKSLLTIQLLALQEEGKLNILSSPSITTLDNQTALIESGEEVPFQSVSDFNVKIEYKKAVLSLRVTPHVIGEETLKLKIITSDDEVDFSRSVRGNPTILTKKAETNVIVQNGQTTVIAGLSKKTMFGGESGIPGLKDVPGAGWLFKETDKRDRMQDLLIFITPYILEKRVGGPKIGQK